MSCREILLKTITDEETSKAIHEAMEATPEQLERMKKAYEEVKALNIKCIDSEGKEIVL